MAGGARGWRDWIIFMLAAVGWAGFVGTVIGQLSINDQLSRAKSRAEEAESKLAKILQQNDEILAVSQQLSRQRELLITELEQKSSDLEQRLKKYEP